MLDKTSELVSSNEADKETHDTSPSIAPSFNSYKFFRRREDSDMSNQLLNLFGTHMNIRQIDEATTANNDDFSSFEEEIFEQEGVYEELFAYDNQEEEYMFEHNKRLNLNKRRRHGLPPITPKAAMKDLVLHFLFNHMWSELIDWSAETIKCYAKSISDEFESQSCLSAKGVSSGGGSGGLSLDKIMFNKSKTDLLPSISPTYNSSSSTSLLVTEVNSTANINLPPTAANVTKANIIQLKLFDPQANSIHLLSRDNSTLTYTQPSNANKFLNNNDLNATNDTLGDLVTKDLLQIKQINRNAVQSGAVGTSKPLNPVSGPQMRVNSGTRRQYQNNYYRKRYSSIEMGSGLAPIDKNIIIHGAGLVKPMQISDSSFPLSNNPATAANPLIFSSTVNTRIANTSIQAYHNMNDENIYENEDNDYQFQSNIIDENSIDEINLLNNNGASYGRGGGHGGGHAYYNHGHLNYFGHHHYNYQPNSVAGYKSLPPIENSLTSKVGFLDGFF